ncbi:phosphate/phosphite/phosphonate ABC transporter substrate-binding protein [Bradyrhizobium lablabi]|uniref:phosphate/phosphite/phosphonate ABC transporter substrate-binding protein n=1 Tax=Bradyrhizobium lablabi TaxID=722472 RepID=UPI001BA51823|nr:PhnD/SsuA/transferrin family substrate-binding protein [Bradyrhizobium lablabi]MBR0697711.1 PhnD/SsuA/transferrin family substrate-binding protein [Bradyrhizobium lablabi]
MHYAANARMYSVNPQAAAAWKELFGWLSRESGVGLDVIDHAFPLPLAELWSRSDLGCAFMCGFPFMLAAHRPRPVAAPVPTRAPVAGRPVYATRLLVRADSGFHAIEDTFGGRLGYTVEDSHSGYNALRHHLLDYYRQRGAGLYRESVGPLTTPRRVVDALLAGDIDIGPLDSYALDLMLRHEAELASQVRIVATTDPAPIPFLVAASGCPDEIVARLQATLATFAGAPACTELRDRLCLGGFAPVNIADYELMLRWDAEARAAGYVRPA